MDFSNIIVAVLALIGTVLGSYFTGTKTTAVMQEKIKVIEAKLEKHNQLVERMYKVEKDVSTAFLEIDILKDTIERKG